MCRTPISTRWPQLSLSRSLTFLKWALAEKNVGSCRWRMDPRFRFGMDGWMPKDRMIVHQKAIYQVENWVG